MKSVLRLLRVVAILAISHTLMSAQGPAGPDWRAWEFMKGKWVGEGSSELGEGGGYFTFEPDLQNRAWLRRNRAEYPATKDRPRYVHEDLMVVYFDQSSKEIRAFYYDTEGHAIHYTATVAADGNRITFVSDPHEGAQRFRLTYLRKDTMSMSVLLEMASADHPEDFHQIVEGKVRKVSQ